VAVVVVVAVEEVVVVVVAGLEVLEEVLAAHAAKAQTLEAIPTSAVTHDSAPGRSHDSAVVPTMAAARECHTAQAPRHPVVLGREDL
jgi:hypothetical protein